MKLALGRWHFYFILLHFLPKHLLPYVSILEKDQNTELLDAVLIDDDPYNHEFWCYAAKEKKKNIKCFTSLSEFESSEANVLKTTPIYIDLNLKNTNGLEIAKILFAKGFKRIYITTGYADFEKEDYGFLTGVIGKSPPF